MEQIVEKLLAGGIQDKSNRIICRIMNKGESHQSIFLSLINLHSIAYNCKVKIEFRNICKFMKKENLKIIHCSKYSDPDSVHC